jgi:hypothetical protein
MICCERCNVWQHGPCVGVMSEKEAPEIYYCEECRPDLHELGSRNQGYVNHLPSLHLVVMAVTDDRHRQSRWIGSSIPAQPPRRKKSSASVQQGSMKGESMSPPPTDDTTSKERKPSPKKRSTMNSRDAAYSYTPVFPASSVDEDMKMDDATSPPASRSGESRSRRRGKRVVEDDDIDPPRSLKRRRESNETDDHIGDDHHPHQQPLTASLLPRKLKPTTSKRGRDVARDIRDAVLDAMRDVDSDNVDPQKDDSSSDHQNTPSDQPQRNKPRPPPPKRKPKFPLPGDRTDRIDSEEPPATPTMRKEEIRPARARIPQARSGLNEMRKRVGAIMEYVGRLQADIPELPDTPSTSPTLHPFPLLWVVLM